MVKKEIPKKLEQKIISYINTLKTDKLPINKVILYGSYAKDKQNKWSDVDLCIVSPKFSDSWRATDYLWSKLTFDMQYTIEPIGFSIKDFKEGSLMIDEIKTTGIEIPV